MKNLIPVLFIFWVLLNACNQAKTEYKPKDLSYSAAKGKLFIIGGGELTNELLEIMLATAGMDENAYMVVLPMRHSLPDSAYLSLYREVQKVFPVRCYNFNLSEADLINQSKLDSVRNARLIYITSGDQNRFMHLAKDTPLQDAIYDAFENGALLASNGSGSALMSENVITGDENFSPEYSATYDKAWKGNAIYEDGLGLLKNVLIDPQFVTLSRYNRLVSALCDFPGKAGIGIDEKTALLVEGDKCTVIGESQVVTSNPLDSCGVYFNHLNVRNWKMNMYTSGDSFLLSQILKK